MLQPRFTPCLLIRNKGLVKTLNFKPFKYIGDPINAVKIFNEKEADELIVLDIDATSKAKEPDFAVIKKLAAECRMPLCYGGGIKTAEQAQKIFALGVEKIAISSIVIENPEIITEIANVVGNQSVVVVLDVKKKLFGGYEIYTHNGTKKTGIDPLKFVEKIEKLGFSSSDIFNTEEELHKTFVSRNIESEISISSELKQLEELFDSLLSKTNEKGMQFSIRAEKQKQLNVLKKIEQKLNKAEKQKHSISLNQISQVKGKLFPESSLQERYDNIIPFYLVYGNSFIENLKESLNPLNQHFSILIQD